MTAKKQITNPLALAVLVHLYEKPRHPYELAATLKERRKEQSIRLNYGSLYTVIEALVRDGHIRPLETKREGRRPEKTVYQITPAGEAFMMGWMRELISAPVKEYPQFEAALSLLPVLPPDEVVALLESRIRTLKETFKSFEKEEQERRAMQLPRLFSIESEYHEAMISAELKFVEALYKDLKNDTGGLSSIWKQLRRDILGSQKQKKSPKGRKKESK